MRGMATAVSLGLAGCASDYDVTEQARRLETESLTVDAGLVAVGERAVIPLFLASTGPGRLTVLDVAVDDADVWEVRSGWASEDLDEDGAPDAVVVDGGSPEAPSFALVELIFKPDAEGTFRTVLTVTSNDTEVTSRNDDDDGLWRVVLRGRARFPCGSFVPGLVDYGPRPPGGFFAAPVAVENCGPVPLTISNFTIEGDTSFSVATSTPLTVLPGQTGEVEIAFEPGGGAPPAAAVIRPVSASPDFNAGGVAVRGNTCLGSAHPAWDADGDGGAEDDGDCDDADPWVGVGAVEDCDEVDNDCDGVIDEGEDDAPGGACAFRVEREAAQVKGAKGCSNVPPGAGAAVVFGGLLGLLRRRRPCPTPPA